MSTEFIQNFDLAELNQWLKMGSLLGLNENEVVLGWGELQYSAEPSSDRPSFYTPDFYLEDDKPFRVYENYSKISRSKLVELLKSVSVADKAERAWKCPLKQDFQKVFNEIQSKMESGDLKKAVPVIFETSEGGLGQTEKVHCLITLLEAESRGQFSYGFWDQKSGVIGKSPEILFRLESGVLKTMALAGTRPAELYAELLDDEKELEEHRFVVEDIEAQLKPFGKLQIFQTQAEVFWPIAHLKTKFQLNLNENPSWQKLILSLHPTPALGALPRKKITDLKFLECNERRGGFGAPFGLTMPDGSGFVLVAIRNIHWNKDKTYLGSGCGVVSQSICDKEWQELSLKRNTVKKNLGFL